MGRSFYASGLDLLSSEPVHLEGADRELRRGDAWTDFAGSDWTTFGSAGSGNNQFNDPWSMILNSEGKIVIADTFNDRIVSIDDMSGTNWTTFGTNGSGVGQFMYGSSICQY